LIVFFAAGLAILFRIDVPRAVAEAASLKYRASSDGKL
jgi:hypothetical protein